MNNFFDDCPDPEPSRLLGFSDNAVRSSVEERIGSCLSAALDNADSKFVCMSDDQFLVIGEEEKSRLFLNAEEIDQFLPDYTNAVLAGIIEGVAIIGIPINFNPDDLCTPFSSTNTRAMMYASSLPLQQVAAAGMIVSLLHWNKTNQFCGSCGAPSRAKLGGMRRDCTDCDKQIFPRTDPAVIMLTVRGDKCLLGRSSHFPPNWYSCLAGFVEPGESIEQAIRRETMEESGVCVGRVKYFASQPWPFPHSLMIGAYCEALDDEINFASDELEDCRWFSYGEVLAMIEKRHERELRAPPSKSIASALLRNWLEKIR